MKLWRHRSGNYFLCCVSLFWFTHLLGWMCPPVFILSSTLFVCLFCFSRVLVVNCLHLNSCSPGLFREEANCSNRGDGFTAVLVLTRREDTTHALICVPGSLRDSSPGVLIVYDMVNHLMDINKCWNEVGWEKEKRGSKVWMCVGKRHEIIKKILWPT